MVALAFVLAACGDSTSTTSPASVSTLGAATTAVSTVPAATTVPATTVPAAAVAPATTEAPATTAPATTVDPDAPIEINIDFYEGQASGPGRSEVNKGDMIEIVVTSDVADEVHVHGYDVYADVAAGDTVRIAFAATIQGIFEVELEGARAPLLELVVN